MVVKADRPWEDRSGYHGVAETETFNCEHTFYVGLSND